MVENSRECYHCENHPEFLRSNFELGMYGYRIARVPLREGYVTETLDGCTVGPMMGTLTGTDTGSLRVIALPTLLLAHANCDYAMTTAITPGRRGHTDVEVTFLDRPGPLSPLVEGPLMAFHEWYMAQLGTRASVRSDE
ncbi:SRPBCC family protein [Actinophytocola algeriensis]|uniref:Uncharacterized protein n=1 Tax=Actinophytocola algeriensis TaxID=1768010 RepID=A0A7W7VFZ9_9PSEU|nr:hypothetical protein [Actinophytocola algeriensis]MBB4908922.1 hypothetical protein [Actinophytocola algeriensis]MBE1474690.1 hypothetical protein [Actinophytocola algeriensis]